MTRLDELGTPPPAPGPTDWNDNGVLTLPGFFDADELVAYADEWMAAHGFRLSADGPFADRPQGWPDTCPYMQHDALRDLCCDGRLARMLAWVVGDEMGVNLNLTGWVSTERDWHADSYLNEPEVGDFYAAVWIALADIHPDSGVFQYVPGSHRWPQITRETIGRHFDIADPQWPKHSEQLLTDVFEEEIAARNATVVSHVPKKGDLLIWHGRLLHRGSRAKVPGAMRPALIAHYSGIHHRPQMPTAVQHDTGGWYFPIHTTASV